MILEVADFLHHLLIHSQSTGCIDDDHIVAVGLSLLQSVVSDAEYILVIRLTINRHTHLFAYYMELLDSSRTIYVASHEQRLLTFLVLEHIGKLTAEGSLTRTLQTTHQDYSRATFQMQWSFLASHQLSELVVNQLHHQLAWLHGCQNIHAECFFLHLVGEFLGNFIVNIGIEECTAHILHGLSHVDFGNFTLTLQNFEGTF